MEPSTRSKIIIYKALRRSLIVSLATALFILTITALTTSLAPLSAFAQKPVEKKAPPPETLSSETRQILKLISEKYKKLQHWQASFTEERFSPTLGTGSFSEGTFIFSSPNKFKYSLTGAENSDFISDGKSAWHIRYRDGRTKPAFVRHFTTIENVEISAYLFILRGINDFGPEKEKELLRDFKISGKLHDAEIELILEPKNNAEISQIKLFFLQNKDVMTRATIESSLGNETIIVLKNHTILKNITPKSFVPSFPKGSKIEKM
jgi:outer membrane lipoprotein-sorting protein